MTNHEPCVDLTWFTTVVGFGDILGFGTISGSGCVKVVVGGGGGNSFGTSGRILLTSSVGFGTVLLWRLCSK